MGQPAPRSGLRRAAVGRRGSTIEYAPVGPTLQNGYDLGGSRIYPFSTGLAITPPAQYSDYIGSAQGLPVSPPVSALSGTAGTGGRKQSVVNAVNAPFGKWSPLPWIIGGLILAVVALHAIHYRERRSD